MNSVRYIESRNSKGSSVLEEVLNKRSERKLINFTDTTELCLALDQTQAVVVSCIGIEGMKSRKFRVS